MQATMRLNIVNKETMNVLNRILPNKDNYFERVCVKIGLLIRDSLLNNAYALVALYQLHDEILNLSAYFDDEIDKFEGQIEKKKMLDPNKVKFIAKYDYDMPCGNALTCALYELMEGFDRLISTVKLLYLSGLMESKPAFYQLKQRYQKNLNRILSKIIQTSSSPNHHVNLMDIINGDCVIDESVIDINTLKDALNSPYAPGFSPQKAHQLRYKLNQLSKKAEREIEAAAEIQS